MKTVDLTISTIIEHLDSGLSWLKKDDTGAGSIQEKYEATEIQIKTIQKHPKLASWEPTKVTFNIIDDLKDDNTEQDNKTNASTTKTTSSESINESNGEISDLAARISNVDEIRQLETASAVGNVDTSGEEETEGFLAFR